MKSSERAKGFSSLRTLGGVFNPRERKLLKRITGEGDDSLRKAGGREMLEKARSSASQIRASQSSEGPIREVDVLCEKKVFNDEAMRKVSHYLTCR